MKKFIVILLLTLSVEYIYASDDIYLDCSQEYNPSAGSRSVDLIRINKIENYVHQYDILLFYKKNPDYFCSWSDTRKCDRKKIPRYLSEYDDKYGEVKFSVNKSLKTYIDMYAWEIKFPCCGSAWRAYRDTNGVTTRGITRDTLRYYGSITWPEESVKNCKILDKSKFYEEVEYFQTRWETLKEQANNEQMKKNKI